MHFRDYHLLQILQHFETQRLPLDVFLSRYFRANPAIGSKDRRFLSDAVYEKFRAGFPGVLSTLLDDAYGKEKAEELRLVCKERAPITVRINPLKTSREALLEKWKPFSALPCTHSPYGVVFPEKINFFTLPEFKEGLFEIQDEGSQLISFLIEAKPQDHVLDFCAGGGGKTLAFAYLLQNRGQIFLHDIRPRALLEAKKRLCRAGIQNVQFRLPLQPVDWVLVDTPCTGTGTLRRNPDLKDKFSLELLSRLILEQRQIFEKALSFLKPKGKIVYATCSILPQENQDQIAYFSEKFNLTCVKTFQSLPTSGGMDGFFGAVLKK